MTEFPELPNNERLGGLAVQGTAAAGHFRIASVRADSFDVVADSLGRVEVEFVAGFIGGAIEVIAIATLDTLTVADTVAIDVRVPGLVPLEAAGSIASVAYFVGGTTSVHPQGTNWYVRPELVTRLAAIATGLANLISEAGAFYPQFNDASLSRGGSFNGAPGSLLAVSGSAATVDNPLASHATHALGVDLDVAFCYSESSGAGDQSARVSWDSEEGCRHWLTEAPLPNLEMHRGDGLRIMRQYGDAAVHDGNHFHIRFWEGS